MLRVCTAICLLYVSWMLGSGRRLEVRDSPIYTGLEVIPSIIVLTAAPGNFKLASQPVVSKTRIAG